MLSVKGLERTMITTGDIYICQNHDKPFLQCSLSLCPSNSSARKISIDEIKHTLPLAINCQFQYIWTGIMTGSIKILPLLPDTPVLDVRHN